ncbi:PREDICTED: probable tubulin polyglutamylase TTLL9 [Atta cephalotes]|uniref:Tubulin--tyrosine ligase-like protein 9 n=1 Tax=Atta cephalotes TaxID=12957 RepID=A0A158NUC3_ATTCE|nr:PREDICTED: probable tubulin polyglutamylase TTLL9 [Atta cephalotes]
MYIVDPEDTNWHLWWCDTGDVLRQALDGDRKLRPYQRVSHFRNHYELTRKNYLYRNLKRYRKALIRAEKFAEAHISDVMPVTFELPSDYLMFVEEYHKQQGAIWIVKPVARSRGKGIFLFRKLKDLIEWKSREVKSQQSGVPAEIYVVQKYIDNPYLVTGRKFDLRIYVLVTSFHPLKVWLAREGFARLCGQLFDLENIDDNRVHLTNTAIQLKASQNTEGISSIKGETGELSCKWALNKLRDYLIAYYEAEVVENLMQRIADLINNIITLRFIFCPHGRVNLKVKKDIPKVVDTVDIEDISEKAVFCRCWRSENWPYCDGTHGRHNKECNDNVGPLIVTKKG